MLNRFHYFIVFHHIICTCTFPFLFYTLIGSLSDDSGFTRPYIRCFIFLSDVCWDRLLYKDSEFLPIWIWYSCPFLSMWFL